MTDEQITRLYGPRCAEHCDDCCVCEVWAMHDHIEELDRHLTLSGKVSKALSERIEKLEAEKAVVADLWEQQKEIALDYLDDCNKAADHIEKLEADNARLRGLLGEAEVKLTDVQGAYATKRYADNLLARIRAALQETSHEAP